MKTNKKILNVCIIGLIIFLFMNCDSRTRKEIWDSNMHSGFLKGYVYVYEVDYLKETSYRVKDKDGDFMRCPVYYNEEYDDYTIRYRGEDYSLIHLDTPEYAYGYLNTYLYWRFDGWTKYVEQIPGYKEEVESLSQVQNIEENDIEVIDEDEITDVERYISSEEKDSEQEESSIIYLSVSDDDLQFAPEGETKIIEVFTNTSWNLEVLPEDWVKTYFNGNKIKIKLECNYEDNRTDYFTIRAEDKIIRIDISQDSSFRCKKCKGTGKCPGDGKNKWEWNQWTGQIEMLHTWNTIEYQMLYNAYYNQVMPQYYNRTIYCNECGGNGKCPVCNGSGEVCELLDTTNSPVLTYYDLS